MTAQYFVYYLPLPLTIHGSVRLNDDGTYSIYLNSRDSAEEWHKTIEHELRHIEGGHLYSDKPVWKLELEADGISLPAPETSEPKIYASLEDLRENFI